jgi:hypothetical protein
MHLKNYTLSLVFCSILNTGFASTDFDGPRELFMSIGTNGLKNPPGTLQNFRKLQPNASILFPVTGNNYQSDERSDYNLFLLGYGFKPKRKGPTFRLAFGGGISSYMLADFSTGNFSRYDTLTSSRTGQQTYIDSTIFEKYRFEYTARMITIDISAVWHTTNNNKMKFFAGIGGSYGGARGTTILRYRKYSYINTFPRSSFSEISNITETYDQKSQTIYAVYCPFGLDYKLSKTSDFWEKYHIFLEARAQVHYQKIPELGEFIAGRMQLGVGLRVMFND